MKEFVAILLLVVVVGCSKSETVSTDTAQTNTGVTASSTATTASTDTITPGTSSATPTATETVAPAPPVNVATAPGTPSATTASAAAPRKAAPHKAAPHKTTTTATVAPASPPPAQPQPAAVGTATPNTTTEPASAPHVDAAPAPTNDIAEGQTIFKSKCVGCHGADGKKNMKGVVLASAAIQNRSDAELERGFRAGAQHKSTGLSDAQVKQVVAYVKALK